MYLQDPVEVLPFSYGDNKIEFLVFNLQIVQLLFLFSIFAVSYTHLDVYKRQVIQMTYLEDRAGKSANIASERKKRTQANMFKASL